MRRTGWAVAAVAFGMLIMYPLARLAAEIVGAAAPPGDLAAPLWASVWTSIVAAIAATAGGTAAGLLTERTTIAGSSLLRVGFVGTLVLPPFVSAVGWQAAYGPSGLFADAAWIESPVGVVTVIAVNALPVAYLVVSASLAGGDERRLVSAARASGASPVVAFRTVTLRLLGPAIAGSAALTFVMGMNSFGVPMILGTPSGFRTMTTEIYVGLRRAFTVESFERVVMLSLLLVLATSIVAAAARPGRALAPPARTQAAPAPSRPRRWAAGGAWAYLTVTLVLPTVAITARALTKAVGLPPTPQNLTLSHLGGALSGSSVEALARSAALAVGAATGVLALGGLSAWLGRTRQRAPSVAVTVGFAVPGSALAVGMLLGYRAVAAGAALILLTYLAKFWALGHHPITGALDRIGSDVWRSARASGARPLVATATVTMPLLRPALVTAWLTVFFFGIHELTMSSLLHGPGSATLAVVVLDRQQTGDPSATAALALVLGACVAAIAVPLALGRRRRLR
jgi:iron(III) transport system permease protein